MKNLLFITMLFGIGYSTPDWSVNTDAYQLNSGVTAVVYLNDVVQGGEGDLLAAFATDGSIRGVASPAGDIAFGPYVGTPYFELQIYANGAESDISFQYYSASLNSVINLDETLDIAPPNPEGNVTSPVLLHGSGDAVASCDDESACNTGAEGGCEYPATGYDCDGNCTAGEDCAGICGGSAELDECGVCGGDGTSCGGPPDCLSDCADIESANPEEDAAGFCEWITTTEFANCSSDCDSGILFELDMIISLCLNCLEQDPTGEMEICEEMILGGNAPCQDCYDNCPPEDDECYDECDAYVCDDDVGGAPDWSVNSSDYQLNSGVTAIVYLYDIAQGGEGDLLAAFATDGTICGVASPAGQIPFGPYVGTPYFELQIYANGAESDISFQYYSVSLNGIFALDETIGINPPTPEGDFIAPVLLHGNASDCDDESACNTGDAGDCEYPATGYDCDGNCTLGEDCAGECGGSAELDECGVCGGDGIGEGECDCEGNVLDCAGVCGGYGYCIPELFDYNISTQQSFYYFFSVTIGGDSVDANDWVGAFNGDVCAGARQWDTSQCGGGICDIAIMGNEGSNITEGYFSSGDIPTFKIYDASEDTYYDAVASEDIPWEFLNFPVIDNLNVYSDCNSVLGGDAVEDNCGTCDSDSGNDCVQDCAGVWGGTSENDECGVCDADPTNDCAEAPEEFTFNQSSVQAFYFILSATDLYGDPLDSADWIGLFKGDVCVGARQWPEKAVDIPAMGDDGFGYSEGYLEEGDIPIFRIYDASENMIYIAEPSQDYAFQDAQMFFVDEVNGMLEYNLALTDNTNMVSFYILPEENSIEDIIGEESGNIYGMLAEGMAAAYINGNWIGTLTDFDISDGYWIFVNEPTVVLSGIGSNYNPDRVYDLHAGPNLISYPAISPSDLSYSIPDDVESLFLAIIGAGGAAMNTENGWVGSTTHFEGGLGYWAIVSEDLSFSYETGAMARSQIRPYVEVLPEGSAFTVAQSPHQAFYFVEKVTLVEGTIEYGDWLLSFNGNVLTGVRQWQGVMIDIPAMGLYENNKMAGYLETGDIPSFKLLKQSTGNLIPLAGEIPAWSENGIYTLSGLSELQTVIPETFVLERAYPNPFNPVTTLHFSLPVEGRVSLTIYNMQGREIVSLIDGNMEAGYHSVIWNADSYSSGVYFVKMVAGDYIDTQKLMLLK